MATAGDTNDGTVRLRPRRSLLWNGVLVLAIVPLPIIVTIFTLGLHSRSWHIAVIAECVVIGIFLIGFFLLHNTYVTISTTHLTERGFFARTVTTAISEVRSIVIVQTFRNSSSETVPQLIVRNGNGQRLLRMRGVFWSEESMRAAVAAIGVPLDEPMEPLTAHQFFEQYAGTAYWFEDRRGLATGLLVLAGLACGGVTLGLMGLDGLPFGA